MPPRYIRHSNSFTHDDFDAAQRDISSALIANVQRVQRHTQGRETRADNGIYVGRTGIVVMEHLLSSLLVADAGDALHPAFSPASLLGAGDRRLTSISSRALERGHGGVRSASRVSFLETDVGVATVVLQRAAEFESDDVRIDVDALRYCGHLLRGAVRLAVSEGRHGDDHDGHDGGCELLYGRAGLLYAVIRLHGALHRRRAKTGGTGTGGEAAAGRELVAILERLASHDTIGALVEVIVARGRRGSALYAAADARLRSAKPVPALMWSWHGKRYLGAAHGVAGILHVLLKCPERVVAPYMLDILATVEWLVGLQDLEGNWASKAPDTSVSVERNELVQWCHGATGIVIMLSAVLRQPLARMSMREDLHLKIVASLHRGASVVYRHGLLRKGIGLCHGVAGSVLALLTVSDAFSQDRSHSGQPHPRTPKEYLCYAVHLAQLAVSHERLTLEGEMTTPDRPWSLYEGMAGMCCAWGAVLCRLREDGAQGRVCFCFPGFDDLVD